MAVARVNSPCHSTFSHFKRNVLIDIALTNLSNSDGGKSWGVIHSIIGGCLVESEPELQGVGNSQKPTRTLSFKVNVCRLFLNNARSH